MLNVSTMTRDQLAELVLKMQQDQQKKLSCKVSEKGAISVYGLGRFPVTLYAGQWERLSQFITEGAIARFIAANEATISRK